MKTIIKNTGLGFLFAGAILIMGSDSDWFPWLNLAAAGILGLVTLLANLAARHRPACGNRKRAYLLYLPAIPDG